MSSARARIRQIVGFMTPALALGLASATWMYVLGRLEGRSMGFAGTLAFVMPFWLVWALYTPFVAWIARQRPIERGHLVARSGMHLGIAIAMAFGNTGVRLALQSALRESLRASVVGPGEWAPLLSLATLELPVHVFLYAAILGVTQIVLYYQRLRERELAATRLRAQLADARMQALKMQLHPHFLFNALNSVAMLVREARRDAAVETLERLGDLLRYVLEGVTGQEVTLRREMDFIERYMAIERMRFQDRLEVTLDVSDDSLDAFLPNLVLQPLVENAIRYGVAGSVRKVTVTVVARRDDEVLRLAVLDDGPGLGGARASSGGTGLGISNTRRRLAELYGDGASLEVEDRSPHGVAATIRLPFHTTRLAGAEGQ